jgi:hypothetical protein
MDASGESDWSEWRTFNVKNGSAIKIISITTNSGAELQPDHTLSFAGGDEWGNTPPDQIHCVAEVMGTDTPIVKWSVTDLNAGQATPDGGVGTTFSFRVAQLPPQDLYTPRPPLGFRVIARLFDVDGTEVGRDEVVVTQSQLGSRRQEYVDHPVSPPVAALSKVPSIAAFDANLHIVSDWAYEAINRVLAEANRRNIQTQVNSVYRSPVHHWLVYRNEVKQPLKVTKGSQHLWGTAVDFDVPNGRNRKESQKNYNALAKLCRDLGYLVIPEGRTDHVHIQQYAVTKQKKEGR